MIGDPIVLHMIAEATKLTIFWTIFVLEFEGCTEIGDFLHMIAEATKLTILFWTIFVQ